ncbi:HAD family phosphatase [Pseudomonas sp. TTU2014-080ASC]|uniref:HAD family phosphatase n=1 Tax=Pseudomonas sp. TTU2014-080ASC TaxID=1729724 RepID=UPI000A47252C|nr:HAD family phosphatase [Pseudomonas sp. TTU2014-080ASC]
MNTPALNAVLFSLSGCLVDFGARASSLNNTAESTSPNIQPAIADLAQPIRGAVSVAQQLQSQAITCAWVETLGPTLTKVLSTQLPADLPGITLDSGRSLPAPDSLWQALATLNAPSIHGCILVSGNPLVLQAGLNAGLWTVGLAVCGSLCGYSQEAWQALPQGRRDDLRSTAILTLYRMGVHSVIDQITDVPECLADITQRRVKGEKP